jgi:hypothetical protein
VQLTVASLVVLVLLAARFVMLGPDIVRLPREAWRDAANAVEAHAPKNAVVRAYLHNPADLSFYLRRPVRALSPSEVSPGVCRARVPVAYVTQPFGIPRVTVPCLRRPGVRHYRFRQYTRGDEMNFWIVPPVR